MNEDCDVKIFTPVSEAFDDNITIADKMKRQVVSGGLQKARLLGKSIAESFPQEAEKEDLWNTARDCGVELTRDIKDQAIILSVFSAEYSINKYISDPVFATTALAALYDALTDDQEELYNKLLSSTAFSFYYMNAEDKSLINAKMAGKTFAMLCGDEESKHLINYGETIFNRRVEKYKKMIES